MNAIVHTPSPVAPKSRLCNCSTRAGKGLTDCQRYAVVRVGRLYFCTQHAQSRGIAIPAPS